MSYDPVEVLAEFSGRHGISFDLLSDEGSRQMENLGLLNAHVAEQQAFFGMPVKDRHRRIPYPGTFVLDEQGVVVEKYFEQSYRDRPSGEFLLHQLGAEATGDAAVARASDDGIELMAWSASGMFRPLEKTVLRLRIALAPGHHAYVEPVPPGYQPLSVEVVPDPAVRAERRVIPRGRPHVVAGLADEFHVVDGVLDIVVPCTIAGRRYFLDGRPRKPPLDAHEVTVALRVAYQICTDTSCFPPSSQTLELVLEEQDLVDAAG